MQADGEAQFSFAAWIREMSTRRKGQLLVTLSLGVLISVSYAIHAARLRDPGYAAVYAAIALDYANECRVMDDRKNPKCDMAINFAQEGLELDPGMADAWAVLAMVRALRYEWAAAQDAVDRFNALPTTYFALGQLQNAWDAVMTFYRNDPLNPEATHFAGAWAYMFLEDRELLDHYRAMTQALQTGRLYASWPDMNIHLVSQEQAIEDARQDYASWGDQVDWAPVIVSVIYGKAQPESAWPILDRWLEEGQVRPAQYWWMLAYTNRVDDFIDLSFQLFDEQTLNTG